MYSWDWCCTCYYGIRGAGTFVEVDTVHPDHSWSSHLGCNGSSTKRDERSVLHADIAYANADNRAGSVLLSRRAAKMRKDTGDPRYQCRADSERASLAVLIKVRPSCVLSLLYI